MSGWTSEQVKALAKFHREHAPRRDVSIPLTDEQYADADALDEAMGEIEPGWTCPGCGGHDRVDAGSPDDRRECADCGLTVYGPPDAPALLPWEPQCSRAEYVGPAPAPERDAGLDRAIAAVEQMAADVADKLDGCPGRTSAYSRWVLEGRQVALDEAIARLRALAATAGA